MKQTFFFYDLETSGLSPREDRIMQFAGIRTDLDFNIIGDPVDIHVKLNDDTLPNPGAIMVTKITPQSTQQDGFTEAEFCDYVSNELFTEGTIAIGYNSVRFDDEFMRHTFWRCFRDPYEWQWKDGRSRWDMLDIVRLTRALRPEGINWPVTEDGRATNRLELITKLNGIDHYKAHDALSDVYALIEVTKLIATKQPNLYSYLFEHRDKRSVAEVVSLQAPQPFVYACGRYPAEFNKTSVVIPIAPARNGNVLVYDLRYDAKEVLESEKFYPVIKELALNKCPAIAPLGVLKVADGYEKIGLDLDTIKQNLTTLKNTPELIAKARENYENKPEFDKPIDPESALYDGFIDGQDKILCNAVRNGDANSLADFHPHFTDERLPELLLHYKAKNYPTSLAEDEVKQWEEYRVARLARQAPKFLKELEELTKSENRDDFILDELKLWYESVQPNDFD